MIPKKLRDIAILVKDEPLLKACTKELPSIGYNLINASSSEQLRDYARSQVLDVLIYDYEKFGGLLLAQQVNEFQEVIGNKNLDIYLMTQYPVGLSMAIDGFRWSEGPANPNDPTRKTIVRGFKAHVKGYLNRPGDIEEIKRALMIPRFKEREMELGLRQIDADLTEAMHSRGMEYP